MKNKNSPIVSIVLGSYNRLPFLKLTLESIRAEIRDLKHEIIVIDGGSNDGSMPYLETQNDVLTIIQHNRDEINGKPVARKPWGYFMNLGFKCAQGKYICMLSDDCLIVPGAIKNGLDLFEKELSKGHRIGSMAFFFRNWPEDKKYTIGEAFGHFPYVNHGLYLNDALKEVNYIDEMNYDFYCADIDLCLRINQAGYECSVSPDSYIEHYSHSNIKTRKANSEKSLKDSEFFHKKWGGVFVENIHKKDPSKEFVDVNNTADKFASIFSVKIHNSFYSKFNNFIVILKKRVKKILKRLYFSAKKIHTSLKRKIIKGWRLFFNSKSTNFYSFAILCVKKTEYADMAIENINSLHYLNPNHVVTIYCDNSCFTYLQNKISKFNYQRKVTLKLLLGDNAKPWQYYKIETLIEASTNNQILTDADGVWHDDPIIDKNKITLLVIVNKIKDNPEEFRVAQMIIDKENLKNFNHYVSGFVSIPPKFMTESLASNLRKFNDMIHINETGSLRRISEELAISLALQKKYPQTDILTLKQSDCPGDNRSLESLYYGCINDIIE